MEVTFEAVSGRVHCYWCGSIQVCAVCHHCGKFMCDQHKETETLARQGFFRSLQIWLGLLTSNDIELARRYGIPLARISPWHEFWSRLGVIRICNPEFDYEIIGLSRRDVRLNTVLAQMLQQLANRLSGWLGIVRWRNERIGQSFHCRSCAHYSVYYSAWLVVSLLFALGFLSYFLYALYQHITQSVPLPFILSWLPSSLDNLKTSFYLGELITFVLSCFYARIWYYQRYVFPEAQARQLGPIPIPGHVDSVKIEEVKEGMIRMDENGKSTSISKPATGQLTVPYVFTQNDRYRYFQPYMEKARKLRFPNPEKQPLQAGFILLGEHKWDLATGELGINRLGEAFPVQFSSQENPLLSLIANQRIGEVPRPQEWVYTIPEARKSKHGQKTLPVQIVLSIPLNSFGRVLQIELNLTDPEIEAADKAIIERLELWIANELGEIARIEPEGSHNPVAGAPPGLAGYWQKLTWRKLSFERPDPSKELGTNYRCSLYIQFQEPIDLDSPTDMNTRVVGNLELKIPQSVSGLEQVEVFSPLGELREDIKVELSTRYKVKLDLEINCLSIQTLEMSEKDITRPGAMPGVPLVTRIVDYLSQEGFYIKRIVENPSRISKEGANRLNRYWDIAGRKYLGVYPVNFHLILIGEEAALSSNGTGIGKVKALVTVQSLVTKNTDMKKQVDDLMTRLTRLLNKAII